MTTTLTVHDDGTITCIGGDELPLEALGTVTRERVSRILPVNRFKRFWFNVLRRLVPDDSRIAAWTRSWRGPWEAIILATGQAHVAQERCSCIEWEVQVLQEG
jgi:hypothetical protein